ncbi:hypothetical protein QWJ90_06800 [Microbacterium oryzae]|uniref:hypothetical protein n=1 Tax=Microbacterium oryzae TaxID=743009 RepID=UPI0025B11A59|nr:hypothetical protein [Microbacterium oryzae]MDN3310634.1 hypothetical protein [Microbacterium oryzae]
MSHGPLHPDTLLGIRLASICSRHRFDADAEGALAELRAAYAGRMDILAREIGTWIGYYEDEHARALCDGLRRIPGVEEWTPLGRARRGAGRHETPR